MTLCTIFQLLKIIWIRKNVIKTAVNLNRYYITKDKNPKISATENKLIRKVSMIHLVRPTVSPVVNIVFTSNWSTPKHKPKHKLEKWFIISGDGCPSVRTYVYKTKQTDQRVKPLFKLVLWLVLGRGSMYDSSLVSFILLDFKKARTDDMCDSNYQYRLWLWVGQVDQKWKRCHTCSLEKSVFKQCTFCFSCTNA